MKRHYKPNQLKQSSSPAPQLQLAVAIAQYIDEHGDGVREKTIESYRYFTGRVVIAAKKLGLDQKLVTAITTQDLWDLMKVFSDIGLFSLSTDRTTYRTGKFIRQLFNWFETRQLIKTNPSASLGKPYRRCFQIMRKLGDCFGAWCLYNADLSKVK